MNSKCSISGFDIEKNSEWKFSSKDYSYSIEVSIINKNIVHLEFSGNASLENRQSIWGSVLEVIENKIKGEGFYLLQDFSKVKSSSSLARYKYINWVLSEKSKILGVYFYSVPTNILLSMKAALFFINTKDWLFIMSSYNEAIKEIQSKIKFQNSNNENAIDLRLDADIAFDKWEEDQLIISKSGQKYLVKKRWIHEDMDAKTITYLLNKDILVRLYEGDFGDQTLKYTAKSLDDILKEIGLKDQPYHFYIDFSQTNKVTLKYRQDSVKWYKENNQFILTSGFFHMTPILRMGVNIARSFASNENLVSKVHLLSNVSEMFEKIEGFNYSDFETTKRKKAYQKLTKNQLISKLEEMEEQQHSQIESIKYKLGRLSWDQDLKRDKFEIDRSNNPFADVHNSLRLIQDDLADILSKRDELIKKAEESDQLKSAFLANTSHEIRTPMNSIIGFSDLLEQMDEMPEEAMEFLQVIKRNGQHLLTIINDIIDISKIEAGQLNISMSQVALNDVFKEVQDIFEMQLKHRARNLEILFENEIDQLDLKILTDPVRLNQIIFNLLSNALKYTKEGFVKFRMLQQSDQIVFEVSDSGLGISQEDQESLFQRFSRSADMQKNIKFKGSGLGLSISKAFVDLLGGKLEVISELDKGSVFTVYLPLNAEKSED